MDQEAAIMSNGKQALKIANHVDVKNDDEGVDKEEGDSDIYTRASGEWGGVSAGTEDIANPAAADDREDNDLRQVSSYVPHR